MKRQMSVMLLFLVISAEVCIAIPTYEEIRSRYAVSDAVLLDRHGEVIHELRVDPHGRRLEWTALDRISPALVRAVVRSEDKRFYDHHGADWKALFSSALGNLLSRSKRGASTITMQLASMLDGQLRSGANRRTIGQKWKQIEAAQELERAWTKDEIFEAYLNLVSLRGELQGITAASRGLFDKDPGGLDESESVVLASLIRSPNASPEKVGKRAVQLAASLGISAPKEQIEELARDRLSRPYTVRRRVDLAPCVAQRLLHEGKTKAVSTLDAGMQRFASEALEQAVSGLSRQNVRDGAVLVVDNRTGDVLAYVGNSGRLSSAPFVDGIQARRQAGSTLKPFLYGLAIERRLLTAASFIDDAPIDLPTARGVYRPENYDREFRGTVTARMALASSMNIPAVKTLGLVGTDVFVRELRAFGFTDLSEAEHYGPSLALGSADITLWELVNAYRTMANGGVRASMRLSLGETAGTKQRVLSAEASFIISDILSDREARSATFSLENALATKYWTAVKTGTSKDMRDNWCIGYSKQYTVGVWVGNFSGSPMWNVSGVSGAAPVWLEIMNDLHRALPSPAPGAPEGVSSQIIMITDRGGVDRKREWFIAGTEPEKVFSHRLQERPKIIYPAPGTIIAVDPDIPDDLQKILFEASPSDSTLRLALDNVVIGSAPMMSRLPAPGIHRLSLLGQDGVVADQITFEVR
jgi:penicillin-binding protein 1C